MTGNRTRASSSTVAASTVYESSRHLCSTSRSTSPVASSRSRRNRSTARLCRMRCSQVTNDASPRKDSARWRGAQQGVLHEILGQLAVRCNIAGIPEQAGNLVSDSATNVRVAHTATLLRNGVLRSRADGLLLRPRAQPQQRIQGAEADSGSPQHHPCQDVEHAREPACRADQEAGDNEHRGHNERTKLAVSRTNIDLHGVLLRVELVRLIDAADPERDTTRGV